MTPTADPARIGTIFGTGVGGIQTLEEQIPIRLEKGERRVSPFLVPMMMANAAGARGLDAIRLQGPERDDLHRLRGRARTPSTYAARLIAWGLADAVVTGGSRARRHGHRRSPASAT